MGNKQRFAHEIVSCFPAQFNVYREPFLGSGAVLGTLAPRVAVASDVFEPLVQLWQTLQGDPECLKRWYRERWHFVQDGLKTAQYEKIKARYNASPNAADLLFLCRSCYGGVVRFRKADGHMSTPCGVHEPISPDSFARRVELWHARVGGSSFLHLDYKDAMLAARSGDLIYCDPPYSHSQTILYGAQSFNLSQLFEVIAECKRRGVYVALSIDGTKKSGNMLCELPIPPGLFARESLVNCGRAMLKRLQMKQRTLENEVVADRLLLTY